MTHIKHEIKADKYSDNLILFSYQKDEIFDGNNNCIDGNTLAAHLIRIHDCTNLTIKNLTFKNGDTSVIKKFKRSEIYFRQTGVSIYEVIDGGAVVITGNSTVNFENCKFINNNSIMCGGAISNQSRGVVSFINCIFENNTAGHTGAAIDNLSPGSNSIINNCKFVNNKSNSWNQTGAPHGQISIFSEATAAIQNCKFIGGSAPYDFVDKGSVIANNNLYDDLKWKARNKSKPKASLIDFIRMLKSMYWIVPKIIGKVVYKII